MAALLLLPRELLTYIVQLASEGATIEVQQRSRFTLSLIARAFFLACADATTFYVAGEKQCKALIAKLEREKMWAALEERKAASGRTTRSTLSITRVSRVCKLTAVLTTRTSGKTLATLLRATPGLAKLELVAQEPRALEVPALEPAMERLVDLRELRLEGNMMNVNAVIGLLCSLPALEVLNAGEVRYRGLIDDQKFQNRAVHPRLRVYRTVLPTTHSFSIFQPPPHASNLLAHLAASPELRVLDLTRTTYSTISKLVDELLPLLARLTHLVWTPGLPRLPDAAQRGKVLELLAALVDLEDIKLCVWQECVTGDRNWPYSSTDEGGTAVDHALLDTLATLPKLHTVRLFAFSGILDGTRVISFIKSCPVLRVLSINITTPSSPEGWTPLQRERVQAAAEDAKVEFTFEGKEAGEP